MRTSTGLLLLAAGILVAGLQGCTTGTTLTYSQEDESLPVGYQPSPAPAPTAASASASGRVTSLADITDRSAVIGSTDFGSNSDKLQIVSDDLKDEVDVTQVGSGRSAKDMLSVFAALENKTDHALAIEVQTVYEDHAGKPLPRGRSSWIPITLHPHGEMQYRSVALTKKADDFQVRVRAAE